jgi:hypothetical protein
MRVLALLAALAACTDHRPPIKGTQSLQVDLVSPTDPGTIDNRLAPAMRTVTMNLTALDAQGQVDTSYNKDLQVYVQFLGTLTPYFGDAPLATVAMAGGHGTLANFMLPPVFGPTTVWFDDGNDPDATYATGVSPTLWYADPFIADIRNSEALADPFGTGPIDNKNVAVLDSAAGGGGYASRFGASGRLVITSVYAQGYTVSDVQCQANGAPPCNYATQPGLATIGGLNTGYDSIDVYSYSAPLDQQKKFLTEGQSIDGFSGGVSEFDGLLEIGFPQTFVDSDTPEIDPAREPAPIKVDATWFTNIILFKRFESAALELDNVYVCPLDSNYAQYKQWSVDLGGTGSNCGGNVVSIVSSGITIDPSKLVGTKLTKVVGIERSVNIGTFHVFIIYPRGLADITP